jgi:hypothetical protein
MAIGAVLRRPTYAATAVVISFALSSLFWALTFTFTPTPLPNYIVLYGPGFTFATLILSFTIAILTGINTSLLLYRKRMTGSLGFRKGAGVSACSALTGAVASGCPVCTAPVLALFGLGGALALFPFQGLELKMAATVTLAISTYFTSKNVKLACKT